MNKMSARELMIYQIQARGQFVKQFQENVKQVIYKSANSSSIIFGVKGVKTEEEKEIKITLKQV